MAAEQLISVVTNGGTLKLQFQIRKSCESGKQIHVLPLVADRHFHLFRAQIHHNTALVLDKRGASKRSKDSRYQDNTQNATSFVFTVCIGTFITEWVEGEAIFKEIFESETAIRAVVKAMVDVCVIFKLDGWFLNVENKIDDPAKLKYFVKTLSEEVHERKPGSLVIWYDSVTETGALAWQNELNASNRLFCPQQQMWS